MAQTQKTIAAIYTLLADNATGAISPQDIRDAFESWRMSHGQIWIPPVNATETAITSEDIYVEVSAPAWSLTTGAASHNFDESDGNGRLTYIGTEPVTAHCALSYSIELSSGTNEYIAVSVGVNGTPDTASEQRRKVGTGGDLGAGAAHLITTLNSGDYLSCFVKNETSTANVIITNANLQAVAMTQ